MSGTFAVPASGGSDGVDETEKATVAERFIECYGGWDVAREFVESCGEDTFNTVDDWNEAFDSYLTGLEYGV